jgi:hypothetical protein
MSRRGCSLPANASGFDTHHASISSRFGQVGIGQRPKPPAGMRGYRLTKLALDSIDKTLAATLAALGQSQYVVYCERPPTRVDPLEEPPPSNDPLAPTPMYFNFKR